MSRSKDRFLDAEVYIKGGVLGGWRGPEQRGAGVDAIASIDCGAVGKEARECASCKQGRMLLPNLERPPEPLFSACLPAWCWGPVLLLGFPSMVRLINLSS